MSVYGDSGVTLSALFGAAMSVLNNLREGGYRDLGGRALN